MNSLDSQSVSPALSVLDLAALPALADFGFTGGRNSFRSFCASIFASPEPRFLRSNDNQLVVFRNADLRALAANADVTNVPPAILFPGGGRIAKSGEPVPTSSLADVVSNQVFTANAPIHGPIRKILLSQFGPKQVAQLESLGRATAQAIIDELHDGEIDFVTDVAEKLTIGFWAPILGISAQEIPALTSSVRGMTGLYQIVKTREGLQAVDEAFGLYGDIVERASLRSLSEGGHPIIEAMARELATINFEDDPTFAGIVPRNVGALLAGNLVDAFHTAALGAVNTLYVLLHQPEALEAVRNSPDLLGRAVFEALRVEPPVLFLGRYVARDVEYDGVLIPRGTRVTMLWGAGNYDPGAFPDPERFDLARSHQGLTTFGGGVHICPGRFVAVMLTKVLLECLEADGIEVAPASNDDQWIDNHMMGQLRAMPLRIHKGRRSKQ